MTRFPEPLDLPPSVPQQRKQRLKSLLLSSAIALAIRGFIVLVELVTVAFFGSAALFTDALASSVDIVFTLFLMICLKFAERPPDENHPFGHGKLEPLIGLFVSTSFVFLGITTGVIQSLHLAKPEVEVAPAPWIWLVPLFAVVCLEISYQVVSRTAKKAASTLMESDAAHYRIDSLSSLFATIALFIAAYNPEMAIISDHIGALSIAVLMVGVGIYTARGNIHQLLDRTPEEQYFNIVRDAAKNVPGVLGTEKIRIQLSGPDAHVDIDIEVEPNMSVEVAHTISQKVRLAIQQKWPSVRDVTVHIEPYYPDDH